MYLVIKRLRGVIYYLVVINGQNTWSAVAEAASQFNQAQAQSIATAEGAEILPV